MNRKILIVDDNEQFCESLNTILTTKGYSVKEAFNSAAAFNYLGRESVDLILLDVRLGDENGPDILVELQTDFPFIPVVMLTGFGTIESAVNSIKMGAYDYIQKPVKFADLLKIIDSALSRNSPDKTSLPDSRILSQDSKTLEILETINKLAPASIPILLQGENGIGKEMFADHIHSRSTRQQGRFIKINCAAFTDSLLDNELFGHDKGAYTGADSLYKGVFEKSDKGTLFLDEIGDMSLSVQSKVLRVLQNKELFRLGGNELVKVDIRIIAATNKNLEDLILENKFRQDLYYRLNAATIIIPSLRERKEDIPELSDFFVDQSARENRKNIKGISREVLERFFRHNWPGNIRELKNVISYAVAVSVGNRIEITDLPEKFVNRTIETQGETLLQQSEKTVLLDELKRFNFNKKRVAESLNISRSTLYSKLKKYEITI